MKKKAFSLLLSFVFAFAAPVAADPPAEEESGRDDYEEGILREEGLDGYLKEPAEAAACYRRAAEKGFSPAKVRLGKLLREGAEGLEADPRRAFALFGEAARAGDPEGMERIGSIYAFGDEKAGVAPNGAQAVKWLEKSAKAGFVHAKTMLGLVLVFGLADTERDEKKGMELMVEAAEGGDWAAMWNCAQAYESGDWGVEADETRSLDFYRRAAAAGSHDAAMRLARAVRDGELGLEADPDPVRWWNAVRKAAEAGSAEAQENLAYGLLTGSGMDVDREEGVRWLRKAAAQGRPHARGLLGTFLVHGVDPVEKNLEEGIFLLRGAAEAGDVSAALELGDLYGDGKETERDEKKAFLFWKIAAESDTDPEKPFPSVVRARNRFANAFRYGWGDETAVSREQALAWAKEAAETGDSESMLRYACALRSTRFGKPDDEEGDRWLERAATAEEAVPEAKQQWGMTLLGKYGSERREEALRFLCEAADAGDAEAAYSAASELFEDDDESEKGRSYLVQAANAGHAGAKNDCAIGFAFGQHGFGKHPELVERLFVEAYENGSEIARSNLGVLLVNGTGGLEKDERRGLQLILDSANRGNATAMKYLGDFYAEGRFFEQDPDKAREWYRKAGVDKEIPAPEAAPAAEPAPEPAPAPAARDDRTTVRVAAGKGPAAVPFCGFFPVSGATIGKTTIDELLRMGARAASGQNARKFAYYPAGTSVAWWDNNGDGVCEKVQLFRSDSIPAEWKALGVDLGMSYDDWLSFFRRKGFAVKTTRGPEVQDYKGRKTFVADVKATAPDGSFECWLYFFAGNEKGEGWFASSRNSLFILSADSTQKKW